MTSVKLHKCLLVLIMLGLSGAGVAADISIVGSSTVYPFMRKVVNDFSASSDTKVTLEATGTGTGFDYFCAGMDGYLPDINNASRPMSRDDFRNCRRNGVRDVIAITIGYDGIVAFVPDSQSFAGLSTEELYRALANEVLVDGRFQPNTNMKWSDINSGLPAERIQILGPPPTSGTRNYIEDFVLAEPCLLNLAPRSESLRDIQRRRCEKIRSDGAYIDVGEDDAFLIQSVSAAKAAIGLVGYGQYLAHQTKIRSIPVNGVKPTFENISTGRYALSRPLFVYVKSRSIERKPQITSLLNLFFQSEMVQKLSRSGLIPLPADQLRENMERLQNRIEVQCPSEYCAANVQK